MSNREAFVKVERLKTHVGGILKQNYLRYASLEMVEKFSDPEGF